MKSVFVDLSNDKKKEDTRTIEKREPKKRMVTGTNRWISINPSEQYSYVQEIHEKKIEHREPCDFILQQIGQKINGYKGQDIHKKLYNEDYFINIEQVLELMVKSNNLCFYCKSRVHVLYENVREPLQWTLDRIDNEIGHNKGNLVISCLSCNLKRRRKSKDAFLFTTQLNIVREDYCI
jgi:hypothetical protein